MTPELLARATDLGLTRGPTATCWGRVGQDANLVGFDGRLWWWAPESVSWGDVVRFAPRFHTEAEAVTAALDWLEGQ